MHFLLTNDDGIFAPGLEAMAAAVKLIPGSTFTIVAPETEQSSCGHRLTTHIPLTLHELSPRRYSVSGSPADCVRVGLFPLNLKPDVVLSGVNAGGNMGQDLPVSGTAAGAREAAFHSIPAIAVSHYLKKDIGLDWNRVAHWTATLIQDLLSRPKLENGFWNVNFPHLPPGERPMPAQRETIPARSPLPVAFAVEQRLNEKTILQYTARYADRNKDAGSDVEACFGGEISVSRIGL